MHPKRYDVETFVRLCCWDISVYMSQITKSNLQACFSFNNPLSVMLGNRYGVLVINSVKFCYDDICAWLLKSPCIMTSVCDKFPIGFQCITKEPMTKVQIKL